MKTIKSAITTTAKNVVELIKGLDFYQVGHTIGEALSGVNWLQVFLTVKNAV